MATKKPTRSTRTRAETSEEFQEVSKSVRSKEVPLASEKTIQDARAAATRDSVKGLTVDSAVNALTKTSLDVQKIFASLTELITAKVTELNQVQEAVALERIELENLHGADVVKSDLLALIAEHDAKAVELSVEIDNAKHEWAAELEAHNKAESDRISELTKTRTRDEQDFKYNQAILRKKDQDEWNQLTVQRERDAKAKQELLEKGWNMREEVLKSQEKNLADLQVQVAAFPETLKKEVDKNVAIATSSLKKDLTNQFALDRKDLETNLSLSKAEVVSAKTTNATLLDQLARTQLELAKAQEQVTKIAQSALDSASGARALAEVQSMQTRERDTGGGRNKQ